MFLLSFVLQSAVKKKKQEKEEEVEEREEESMWQSSYAASQSLKPLLSGSLQKKLADICINSLCFKHFEITDATPLRKHWLVTAPFQKAPT